MPREFYFFSLRADIHGAGNITIDHDDNQKTCCPIFPPDSAVNFERVKEWLDTCVSNHMQCRKTIAGAEVDDATSNSILPSRVISVGWQDSDTPQLLISNGKSGRYVALSYCVRTLISLYEHASFACIDLVGLSLHVGRQEDLRSLQPFFKAPTC